jgi:hypothetical protein
MQCARNMKHKERSKIERTWTGSRTESNTKRNGNKLRTWCRHAMCKREGGAIDHRDFYLQRDGEKYSQPLDQEGFPKRIMTVDIPILALIPICYLPDLRKHLLDTRALNSFHRPFLMGWTENRRSSSIVQNFQNIINHSQCGLQSTVGCLWSWPSTWDWLNFSSRPTKPCILIQIFCIPFKP